MLMSPTPKEASSILRMLTKIPFLVTSVDWFLRTVDLFGSSVLQLVPRS